MQVKVWCKRVCVTGVDEHGTASSLATPLPSVNVTTSHYLSKSYFVCSQFPAVNVLVLFYWYSLHIFQRTSAIKVIFSRTKIISCSLSILPRKELAPKLIAQIKQNFLNPNLSYLHLITYNNNILLPHSVKERAASPNDNENYYKVEHSWRLFYILCTIVISIKWFKNCELFD